MKKTRLILLLFSVCMLIFHIGAEAKENTSNKATEEIDPYLPDPNPVKDISGWQYVWGDEFNIDGAVDETLWQGEKGFIRGNEKQYYQLKNATISEGRLLIAGKKERVKNEFYDPNSGDYRKNTEYSEYTSASLLGKRKRHFLFGRIEVRAKIDPANGTFPAIWTCGFNKNWPRNGEIDMMEYYLVKDGSGYKPVLTSNFCVGGDNRTDEWAQKWKSVFTDRSYYEAKDPDWMKKYHVYRMDWDEETISLYVDDELRNSVKIHEFKNYDGSIAFHNPQFMMLNLAIKDHGHGIADDSKFEVDYFRIYQRIIDTEKPSIVTGLAASNVSATSCTLNWEASTDNKGVYRYDIYKDGIADDYFVGSTSETTFVVTGLKPNTNMKFRVLALDSVGNYSDIPEPLTITTKQVDGVADGKVFSIINCNSGKVLTPLNASKDNGANIVQVTYTGDAAQRWWFSDMGNDYWSIKNVDNGLAMDIDGASTANGAKNIQWTYTGANNQQWKLVKSGDFYNIINRNSGKYLDISDASHAENWQNIQWNANSGKNQMWELSAQSDLSSIGVQEFESFKFVYDKQNENLVVTLDGVSSTSGCVMLSSVDGKVIDNLKINTNKLKLSTSRLPKGVYVLSIATGGSKAKSYKIIL